MAVSFRSAALVLAMCVMAAGCSNIVDVSETSGASTSPPPSVASEPSTTAATNVTTTTTVASTTSEASTTSTDAVTTSLADTTPPMLEVTYPAPGQVVSEDVIRFRGITEPGAEVVSGRWAADVDDDGSWALTLVLRPGTNSAVFTARDAAGNETEMRTSVTLAACVNRTAAVIPETATSVSSVTGDVDGNGFDDTVTVYVNSTDGSGWVHMSLDYGYAAAAPILDEYGNRLGFSVSAIANMRVGGSPALAVVRVSEGATTGQYGVFAFSDCAVAATTYESGYGDGGVTPARFFSGSSTQYAFGFSCTSTGVVQTDSRLSSGMDLESSVWEITEHEYVYDPVARHFALVSATETLLTWAKDRAAIEAVYRLDCP